MNVALRKDRHRTSPCTTFLARSTRIRTKFFAPRVTTLLTALPSTLRRTLVLLRTRVLALMLAEKSFLTQMRTMRFPWVLTQAGVDSAFSLTLMTLRATIPPTACHDTTAKRLAGVYTRICSTVQVCSVLAIRKLFGDHHIAVNFGEIVHEVTKACFINFDYFFCA
jgi:hypothetical protein